MSVYSNETITQRYKGDFSIPRPALSHEAKAVLAGAVVWVVLLGAVALHDVSETADVHSTSNVEDIRTSAPLGGENAPAWRKHY